MISSTYPTERFNDIAKGPATHLLRSEHTLMVRVLDVLDAAAARLKKKQIVSLSLLNEIIEFLTLYIEAEHHLKEEETLFPMLEAGGIPIQASPIGHLLEQHQQSRSILQQMQRNLIRWSIGDDDGRIMLCNQADAYSQLIREHIVEEDRVLFLLTDSLLRPEAQQAMLAHFLMLENADCRDKPPAYWEQLVAGLEKQMADW